MKVLIIILFLINIGLMYISGTNRLKGIGEVPLIYKHPLIELILNLGIIFVIVTGIGLFFTIGWKLSLLIIAISLFSQKFLANIVNILIIYPLGKLFYK